MQEGGECGVGVESGRRRKLGEGSLEKGKCYRNRVEQTTEVDDEFLS